MKLTLSDLSEMILGATEEEEIKELAMQVREKGAAIAASLRTMESMEKAVADEAKRLSDKAEAIKKRRESFESYVLHNLQTLGLEKLGCGGYTLSLRKNPPKVVIDSDEAIPPRFIVTKQVNQIDRKGIKEALKAGEVVEGARLEQSERLVVK